MRRKTHLRPGRQHEGSKDAFPAWLRSIEYSTLKPVLFSASCDCIQKLYSSFVPSEYPTDIERETVGNQFPLVPTDIPPVKNREVQFIVELLERKDNLVADAGTLLTLGFVSCPCLI